MFNEADLSDLILDGFACVEIGSMLRAPVLHRVDAFHGDVLRLALEAAEQHGYRRPALFTRQAQERRCSHAYLGGLLSWYQRRELVAPAPFHLDAHPAPRQQETFQVWLEQARPDLLLQSWSGDLGRRMLRHAGLKVPSDVGFLSLFHAPGNSWAGIDQHPEQSGRMAVDLVLQQLYHNEVGLPADRRFHFTSACFVPGESMRVV